MKKQNAQRDISKRPQQFVDYSIKIPALATVQWVAEVNFSGAIFGAKPEFNFAKREGANFTLESQETAVVAIKEHGFVTWHVVTENGDLQKFQGQQEAIDHSIKVKTSLLLQFANSKA